MIDTIKILISVSSGIQAMSQVNEDIDWESCDHFLEGIMLGGFEYILINC